LLAQLSLKTRHWTKELGWTLRHPSWRQGFTATYGQPRPLKAAA